MSEQTELKPCPICGSEAALGTRTVRRITGDNPEETLTGHLVTCTHCGLSCGGFVDGWSSPEEATRVWNIRAFPTEADKKMLDDMLDLFEEREMYAWSKPLADLIARLK